MTAKPGEIPAVIRKGWLKRQALAAVVELHALLLEATKDLPEGSKKDGRLVRVQTELHKRGYFS